MQPLEVDEPTVVGPYRLLGRLGSGGMGRVYLGRSAGGRTVAVKIVHPHFALDAEFRARFRREVEAARRVGATWTAPVLDADPDASVPWVATGYAAGPSLAAAVADGGALPPHSARVLGAGLAEALVAVHGLGLVHRDVKPSNVLLTVDGPLLIDFGIARATDGTASLTSTGVSIGSPGYMAPEQILGKGATGAADVFSLGAVLAFAATGASPFPGDSSAALLYKVVHEEPELGSLDGELRELVTQCLAKDPAARPDPADVASRLAPEGAARLVAAGWLPGSLVEQVGRSAVQLLNLEVSEAAPSGPVGFSSPSVDGTSVGVDGPSAGVSGRSGTVDSPSGVADGPSGVVDGPSGVTGERSVVAGDRSAAAASGAAASVGGAPGASASAARSSAASATAAGSSAFPAPADSGVFGPPDPAYGLGSAPTYVPRDRDAEFDGTPQGPGPGKLSVSVAAVSAPGDNGRGRKVSCSVVLAVAGALAAVTVGSALLFNMAPGVGDNDDGGADAEARPSASKSLSPDANELNVPSAYVGTWEGEGVALGGTLPMGTFRVTLREAKAGEEFGTFRQTDPIGGICENALVLKKVTKQEIIATGIPEESNRDVCTKGSHTVRLTPVGDDLKYESDNADAGNPLARMSRVE
ncbi:serine/threonine-protein kinase [Streptomyces cavernae]|uniref:serine/threonine-protein kinase n=1 Tax=Streptomyces cavernae TaxID=2259034 RepID=UPI000FEB9DB1|nr:serine/threonine-protein kinase [Streptomyces cavernae]